MLFRPHPSAICHLWTLSHQLVYPTCYQPSGRERGEVSGGCSCCYCSHHKRIYNNKKISNKKENTLEKKNGPYQMCCDTSQALTPPLLPLSCPYVGSAEFKSLILISIVKKKKNISRKKKKHNWGSRHNVSQASVKVKMRWHWYWRRHATSRWCCEWWVAVAWWHDEVVGVGHTCGQSI